MMDNPSIQRIMLRINQMTRDRLDFLINHYAAKNQCDVIYRLITDEYNRIVQQSKPFDCKPDWLNKENIIS